MDIRTTGYVAACLTSGEYVQLGPFRRMRDAVAAGKTQLPVFEVVHVGRRGQIVVIPFMHGYANPISYDEE